MQLNRECVFCLFCVGFSGDWDGKESACNAIKPGFNPWTGKIPWRRKWQPTLVFLPGKFHGQRSYKELQRAGHNWATNTHTHTHTHTHTQTPGFLEKRCEKTNQHVLEVHTWLNSKEEVFSPFGVPLRQRCRYALLVNETVSFSDADSCVLKFWMIEEEQRTELMNCPWSHSASSGLSCLVKLFLSIYILLVSRGTTKFLD